MYYTPWSWIVNPIAKVGYSFQKEGRNRRHFKQIFGFDPGRGCGPGVRNTTPWHQDMVDAVLQGLAFQMDTAFSWQEKYRHHGTNQVPLALALEEVVEHTKGAYWAAHGLAHSSGYKVPKSYKQYLAALVSVPTS